MSPSCVHGYCLGTKLVFFFVTVLIHIAGLSAARTRRDHWYGGCGSWPLGCGRSGSVGMCGCGSSLVQGGDGCGGGGISSPALPLPGSSSSSSFLALRRNTFWAMGTVYWRVYRDEWLGSQARLWWTLSLGVVKGKSR